MNREWVRLEGHDTVGSAILKLADGDAGALDALRALAMYTRSIDPDDVFGGLGPMMGLDMMGIYGSYIHVLWDRICQRNPVQFVGLLRAQQLGFISEDFVHDLILGNVSAFDPDVLLKVKEILPRFNLEFKF